MIPDDRIINASSERSKFVTVRSHMVVPAGHQTNSQSGSISMKAKALLVGALAIAISFGGASAFAQTKPAKQDASAQTTTPMKKHAKKHHAKKGHKAKAAASTDAPAK
jgi:hypothetical protein